jgi:hypothetical protein
MRPDFPFPRGFVNWKAKRMKLGTKNGYDKRYGQLSIMIKVLPDHWILFLHSPPISSKTPVCAPWCTIATGHSTCWSVSWSPLYSVINSDCPAPQILYQVLYLSVFTSKTLTRTKTYNPNISVNSRRNQGICLKHNQNNEIKSRFDKRMRTDFALHLVQKQIIGQIDLKSLYPAIHFLKGCSSLRLWCKAHKPKTPGSSSVPVTNNFHCK